MATFATPARIAATIEIGLGDVHLIAGERTDTVVDVRPSNATNDNDKRAAEQTKVDFANGKLVVKAPRNWLRNIGTRDGGSIDVTIELPTGSQLSGDAGAATLRAEGALGVVRFKSGAGDIRLDRTGALELKTAMGAVEVLEVHGDANVTTGSGDIRLHDIAGNAVLKNANGDCTVGVVAGALRCNTANGRIGVDRAGGDVSAKTANGTIRVGELTRGSVTLGTALGDIEIGIRPGTAARLDVNTKFGRLRNELDSAAGPAATDSTVEVQARTAAGDIVVRRSEDRVGKTGAATETEES
ncbi:DUF4097 domain-containing protein [Aldersonia sp. NBC_00410]|uniref:DUF4097 family beta strand repeat-containing protein n=1 Tax=Aldersonia sp. NBC_00410 TaxID=2975954 RepID=UPI00225B3EE6|nr:DUF4097 family beta strand repeat-containing protein [Aldersonia sp. NBC_00410]MCX5044954.1 DUF4097 domain-containing protein [Aldersonia sp. NBC_00410]